MNDERTNERTSKTTNVKRCVVKRGPGVVCVPSLSADLGREDRYLQQRGPHQRRSIINVIVDIESVGEHMEEQTKNRQDKESPNTMTKSCVQVS